MSADRSENPYAAPRAEHPLIAVPTARIAMPLETPIVIDGVYTTADTDAIRKLFAGQINNVRKRMWLVIALVGFGCLAVWLLWSIEAILATLIAVGCALQVFVHLFSGAWMQHRVNAALRRDPFNGRRLHGRVTSEGILWTTDGNDSADGASEVLALDWSGFTDAYCGESCLVLKRTIATRRKRFSYHMFSRGLFTESSEWDRFRAYVVQLFAAEAMACKRCRQKFPERQLAAAPLALGVFWPPLLIERWLWGTSTNDRYCRPCRRRVSLAIAFLGCLALLFLVLMLISPNQ